MQVKPVMKRILRRRANEPAPAPEKRRKPLATTLTFQLDERDIDADLRAIARHSPPPRHAPAHHAAHATHAAQPRKHLNSSSHCKYSRELFGQRCCNAICFRQLMFKIFRVKEEIHNRRIFSKKCIFKSDCVLCGKNL